MGVLLAAEDVQGRLYPPHGSAHLNALNKALDLIVHFPRNADAFVTRGFVTAFLSLSHSF